MATEYKMISICVECAPRIVDSSWTYVGSPITAGTSNATHIHGNDYYSTVNILLPRLIDDDKEERIG